MEGRGDESVSLPLRLCHTSHVLVNDERDDITALFHFLIFYGVILSLVVKNNRHMKEKKLVGVVEYDVKGI